MKIRRTKTIKIRLFEEELARLNELKTHSYLAVWMRESCLAEKKKNRRKPAPKVDPSLLRQLAAIGNNVNQIARITNSRTDLLNAISIIAALHSIKEELELLRGDYACKN